MSPGRYTVEICRNFYRLWLCPLHPGRQAHPHSQHGRPARAGRIIVRYKETGAGAGRRPAISDRPSEPSRRWRPPPLKGKNTIEIQEKDSRTPFGLESLLPSLRAAIPFQSVREYGSEAGTEREVHIIIRSAKWRPRGRCHYISRPSDRSADATAVRVRRPSGAIIQPTYYYIEKEPGGRPWRVTE